VSKAPPPSAGQAASPAAPALLERHGAHLRAYLAALPGADARKVGDVFELLKRELSAGQELDDEPAVWLFTRGRRHLIGAGQRGEALPVGEHESDEAVEGRDPAVAVHHAFGRLTAKQQEALRLRWQFGFNLEEMARVTGLSAPGMEVLFQNALGRVVAAFPSAPGQAEARLISPQLIAYALDEMGAAEKRAFAESVADGKELLETAETIRRTVRTLKQVLQNGAPPPRRPRRRGGAGGWLAAAVALAVGVGVWGWLAGRKATEPGSPRLAAQPARGEIATEPGARRESTVAWRTADRRERRPGEAAWEKKPFGRGNGQSAGLVGDGQGGGDAPLVGDATVLDELKTDEALPDVEAAEEEMVELPEATVADDTPVRVLTLAGGAGGGAAVAASPSKAPAGGPGSGSGSTFDQAQIVPQGEVKGLPAERKPVQPAKPPFSGSGDLKRLLAGRGWPRPDQVRPGDLLQLAPPERSSSASSEEPVAVNVEMASSPFEPGRKVMRVVVQAQAAPLPARPAANLVLAIDVSHSMETPNRLPLVREGVRRLAERLRPDDCVAIVAYAAEAREVRPSAPVGEGGRALRESLDGLKAEGRTNGHEGLLLAYELARAARTETGLNAVILCTDGNFNLGETDDATLAALAEQAASEGMRLSVFGFGRSDRNDLRLELLARHGGGRSCYVNTAEEAERLLAGQVEGLFEPVAREVAAQVTFDPERIAGARVLGGNGEMEELLPGRSLALLYDFEWQAGSSPARPAGVVQVNYRPADGTRAGRVQRTFGAGETAWHRTSSGFRFAVALAELGRILQGDAAHAAPALDRLETWTKANLPDDAGGYRRHLLETVALARGAAGF